jgi:hypothetical protein
VPDQEAATTTLARKLARFTSRPNHQTTEHQTKNGVTSLVTMPVPQLDKREWPSATNALAQQNAKEMKQRQLELPAPRTRNNKSSNNIVMPSWNWFESLKVCTTR